MFDRWCFAYLTPGSIPVKRTQKRAATHDIGPRSYAAASLPSGWITENGGGVGCSPRCPKCPSIANFRTNISTVASLATARVIASPMAARNPAKINKSLLALANHALNAGESTGVGRWFVCLDLEPVGAAARQLIYLIWARVEFDRLASKSLGF